MDGEPRVEDGLPAGDRPGSAGSGPDNNPRLDRSGLTPLAAATLLESTDTNACLALIDGSSVTVRSRFRRALAEGGVMCVSSIVLHELWYGVAKSTRREYNTERVQMFLAGPIEIVHVDEADARAAGEVRAALERLRTPIGAYDTLIAGQAARRGLTLVTANTRAFERVEGLMWEDWGI